MKIGIYTGSFNPIHKGHLKIINYLIDKNYVDKVILIPTGNYWDKQDLINIADRIQMAKFYENDKIMVNSTLNHLEYTYQVLMKLKSMYLVDELRLIIGADNLEKFHLWREIDEILTNKVLVIPRNKINTWKYINKFSQKENFIVVDEFPLEEISSTTIRKLIGNGKFDKVKKYLKEEVLNYIIDKELYKENH